MSQLLFYYQLLFFSSNIDTGRLTTLLEQYRDRLHTRGEEEHDEDIVYLLQVLESPLMREYLTRDLSEGGAALVQEMASVLQDHENDVNLSPQSKRKRQLARQASLRALKIALTPQSSPASSPRISKASENRLRPPADFPLTQNFTAAGYGNRGSSHESTPSPRGSQGVVAEVPHPFQHPHMNDDTHSADQGGIISQEPAAYNLDHIYINPYTGKREYPVATTTSTSPTNTDEYDSSHQHVLSNSTNTLIERTVTPYNEGGKKFSSAGSDGYSDFVKKGLNSEDIRTPELGDSQEDFLLSKLTEPTIAPSLVPAHRKGQEQGLPPLPSYTEALSSQHRVKSYEDLLSEKLSHSMKLSPNAQTPDLIPTIQHHPYPIERTMVSPPNPPSITPATPPEGQLITLSLIKGTQGLGFRINKKKNAKKGELNIYVQDIQPGGLAEREGICKGDYLVSINRQKLVGIGVPTAVSLLQQAKGGVEIVIFRKEGGTHDGSPSPTLFPVMSQPMRNDLLPPTSPKTKVTN